MWVLDRIGTWGKGRVKPEKDITLKNGVGGWLEGRSLDCGAELARNLEGPLFILFGE